MNLPQLSVFVLVAHWLIMAGLPIQVIVRRPPAANS